MGKVVLDSSVLIALIDSKDIHHAVAVAAFEGESHRYLISAISLTETLTAPMKKDVATGEKILKSIKSAITEVIQVDEEIAVLAAKVRKGGAVGAPDALIIATATLANATLWTFDKAQARALPGAVLL